jgi:hypothetical protein
VPPWRAVRDRPTVVPEIAVTLALRGCLTDIAVLRAAGCTRVGLGEEKADTTGGRRLCQVTASRMVSSLTGWPEVVQRSHVGNHSGLPGVTNPIEFTQRETDMRTRTGQSRSTRLALIGASTLASVGMALAIPATAQAADSSSASTTTTTATSQSATLSSRWHYYHSYFWGADCTRVGNYGINHGWWNAYQCRGDWFHDYQLWYRY